MASTEAEIAHERQQRRQEKKDRKQHTKQNDRGEGRGGGKGGAPGARGGGSAKLRGLPKDSHDVRVSKTLSWILRHGSQSEGLAMRPDGYVPVDELLKLPKMHELSLEMLHEIVKNDSKSRFNLVLEGEPGSGNEVWWIRANQGHSMKAIALDLEPITSPVDIPTGIAVHGTNKRAWEGIKEQGLSKMTRNHIHLAQGVAGSGVISGMRTSSQILIFIDVQKAINAGIKFYLSANGVVLTEGDDRGFLRPEFFSRVESADRKVLPGWNGLEGPPGTPSTVAASAVVGSDLGVSEDGQTMSRGVGPDTKDEAVQASMDELEHKMQSTSV